MIIDRIRLKLKIKKKKNNKIDCHNREQKQHRIDRYLDLDKV